MTPAGATYDADLNTVTARIDVSVCVRPVGHVFCGQVKLGGADGASARVPLRQPVAETS